MDGRPLYELVGEKVNEWGQTCMGDDYSYVGAVVGATYPEMGKVLRKIMPKAYILVPGYGAQGGQGKDLVHFFNEDGLGAIVNSSRGIIAAWKQEKYASFGAEAFGDASRAAVEDMVADIAGALANRKYSVQEQEREDDKEKRTGTGSPRNSLRRASSACGSPRKPPGRRGPGSLSPCIQMTGQNFCHAPSASARSTGRPAPCGSSTG